MRNIFTYFTPPIFILLTCSIPVTSMNFRSERKTVWILIRWLHQKPADLDLQCFHKGINLSLAGQEFIKLCMFLMYKFKAYDFTCVLELGLTLIHCRYYMARLNLSMLGNCACFFVVDFFLKLILQ